MRGLSQHKCINQRSDGGGSPILQPSDLMHSTLRSHSDQSWVIASGCKHLHTLHLL